MSITWTVPLDEMFTESKKQVLSDYENLALELYNAIIANSPVDSGRYRANHIMTVNSQDFSVNNSNTVRLYAKGFYNSKKFLPIIIQNNLPYAYRLEHGWSKQAPKGIYALSMQQVSNGL
ncbi:HK97 gp10 family phage protein [Moraxella nasovis]|uniref:HK97 gp10 family phage protein n=1 Tax=Moraxella nasovis TaxID=2904121 RepID=UPI001F61FCF4|nr:HK97 gp10 family phage protein [Moraxella nasovis]UNU74110.1 HK97 gp10 family phage protein [Moraxella nasovis]